jgi:cobalamin synthase
LLTFPFSGGAPDATIGWTYSWLAPPLYGLCNIAILLIGFTLSRAGMASGIVSVIVLVLYYCIRGLRLIDGFADLSDGLSLALTRPTTTEKAWDAIRNPTRGSFGILWVGLLLLGQVASLQALMEQPIPTALALFAISGSSGSLALLSAHLSSPPYHPQSSYAVFGKALARPQRFWLAVGEILVLGWASCLIVFKSLGSFLMVPLILLFSILVGRTLISLVLAKLGALNGDSIGFISLLGEWMTLLILLMAVA